jgi:hypothetical protein
MDLVLAYVGPEAALPLLSVLAAIGGVLLIGWRWIASFFRRAWRMVFGRGVGAEAAASSATVDDAIAPAVPCDPADALAARGPDVQR